MATSSGTHEPYDKLSPQTLDIHRALTSLMEELEAIDWYRQRIEVCGDEQLKKILEHNMNEEIEQLQEEMAALQQEVKRLRDQMAQHGDTEESEVPKLFLASVTGSTWKRRGIVSGCGGGNYCPAAPVTRQEMAVFLTVTFGLTLYGP